MAEQLMDELEKAAQIILAAPNLVTTKQRHNAEEVFLNFRKLKSPYELCSQILETNTNDYIVFEAVGLIKIALIRKWPLLSQTHTSSLRDYLLHYVMNNPNLPPYVEGSILQLIAILIKRGTVNDFGQAILEEIENLIMTDDLPKKLLGYNLISIITQEYVLNFMSANIGLSWETHFYEKKIFQAVDLKRIFKFCCRVTEELIKKDLEEDSQMVRIEREFGCDKTKIEEEYFIIYVERFLKFITSVNIIEEEASAIAHIFEKLFISFHRRFNFLSINKFKTFLKQMSQLTCAFLESLEQEESLCVSECLYKEAVDVIFGAWMYVVFDKELFSQGFLKPLIVQMFNTYLRCHLSPPEGIRNIEDKDLEEKKLDKKDTDMKKFKEHLDIIGIFGRLIPHYTLPLLAQLIEDRTSKLREIFNKLVEQIESLHTMKMTLCLMSDIICSNTVSQLSLIPDEIIKYDIEQIRQGNVDTSLTLQFFASSENISSIDNATELADHVIRLVAIIFCLCAIEKAAMSVLSDNILSPELCLTITSFLHIWSSLYLLQLKFHYDEMSPIFLKCFGEDSLIATWVQSFLFEKIEFNINAFKSESAVMERTIKMLISLTDRSQKANYVLNSKGLERIINLATKGQHDLPQVVKRGLMKSVVQVRVKGVAHKVQEDQKIDYYITTFNRYYMSYQI